MTEKADKILVHFQYENGGDEMTTTSALHSACFAALRSMEQSMRKELHNLRVDTVQRLMNDVIQKQVKLRPIWEAIAAADGPDESSKVSANRHHQSPNDDDGGDLDSFRHSTKVQTNPSSKIFTTDISELYYLQKSIDSYGALDGTLDEDMGISTDGRFPCNCGNHDDELEYQLLTRPLWTFSKEDLQESIIWKVCKKLKHLIHKTPHPNNIQTYSYVRLAVTRIDIEENDNDNDYAQSSDLAPISPESSKKLIVEDKDLDHDQTIAVSDEPEIIVLSPFTPEKKMGEDRNGAAGIRGKSLAIVDAVTQDTPPVRAINTTINNKEPQIDEFGVDLTILSQLPVQLRSEARLAMALRDTSAKKRKRCSARGREQSHLQKWLCSSSKNEANSGSTTKQSNIEESEKHASTKRSRRKHTIRDFFHN